MPAAWLKIARNLATVLELVQSHFGRWRLLPETAGEIRNATAFFVGEFLSLHTARVTAVEPTGRAPKSAADKENRSVQYYQSTQSL